MGAAKEEEGPGRSAGGRVADEQSPLVLGEVKEQERQTVACSLEAGWALAWGWAVADCCCCCCSLLLFVVVVVVAIVVIAVVAN